MYIFEKAGLYADNAVRYTYGLEPNEYGFSHEAYHFWTRNYWAEYLRLIEEL